VKAFWLLILVPVFAVKAFPQSYKCLQSDVKLDEIVSVSPGKSVSGKPSATRITVKQTLVKMKARCSRGKLIDPRRREIRFYRLNGCWGNPPINYQEILEAQRIEIAELKKKYSVIEMTCNPDGVPIQ